MFLKDIQFCITHCKPADNEVLAHTTLVGLAAGAVGDSELVAQRAGDGSGTQVAVAFCWVQKDEVISKV